MELQNGQNVPLASMSLRVRVEGPVDLTGLVLSESGKVAGDADMVFFNAPTTAGARLEGDTLHVELGALRPGAVKVALVASSEDEGVTFSRVPVRVHIDDGSSGHSYTPTNLTSETALVLCELYLRAGTWKVRAVGAGYDTGLAGVATDYGIEVDDAATPPPTAPAMQPTPSTPPAPPAPSAPVLNLTKTPLGRVSLDKGSSATISLTKADRGTLRMRASLRWKGRQHGASDLDLYALYIDAAGNPEGAVYYRNRGFVGKAPFIRLDQDSRSAGEEDLTIIAGHHRYVLLCAYSAVGNGVGSFKSYNAHVVIDDGAGSEVTVPLFNENKFSYWVAIALLDFTDPSGARVTQVEQYGKSFSEKRPVLRPDGTFQMSKGKIEFKGRGDKKK
ncbi:TerD family protein [Terracoccus luteus]|uniref:Stress response protein SCP2 n=1 Tax=Terracoccus luteus TaxID=53356 RepID=A0A839PWN8_9MICO|nr:TerD family protein [Terracoccus luteus]MBB2988500.1 stress response protein SCP2 [Terracoccus luteus]MCP2174153.1 stress response protein SCP2 [Terracoccus luteus]